VDCNDEPISQIHVDLRTWPLPIDTDDRSRKTIRACSNPINAPIVLDRLGKRHLANAKQNEEEYKHRDGQIQSTT